MCAQILAEKLHKFYFEILSHDERMEWGGESIKHF